MRRTILVLAAVLAVMLGSFGITATTASAAPAKGGTVIQYGDHYRHLIRDAKTAKKYLPGASKAFKKFAAKHGGSMRGGDQDCRGGMQVSTYHSRGFARGSVVSPYCDGASGLWGKVNGRWKVLAETSEVFSCPMLRRYGVPATVLGPTRSERVCFSYAKQDTVRYRHA